LQDLKKALELSRQEYDYSQLDEPVVPENEESTPAGTVPFWARAIKQTIFRDKIS
jgi:hypothetical protein